MLERNNVPQEVGILSFGTDAINAYMEEMGYTYFQARNGVYNDFIDKGQKSADRMDKINELDFDNFNRTLIGVADPTSSDSDVCMLMNCLGFDTFGALKTGFSRIHVIGP